MASIPAPSHDVLPKAGDVVRVRSRQWLVEDTVPPPVPGDSPLVRLSCLEDDSQGEPLEVLWGHEVDARPVGAASWEHAAERGFDEPRLFSAYLDTLRWNCVTSTDPKLFQAPYRAGIQVNAYQLEPLRKALQMPRVNLFIADDVGIGKTIEAGLIIRELLQRQRVRRILVAAPPSVVWQWRGELEQRFGLSFVVVDADFVARVRRERGWATNPWTTHSRFIISHALLRREDLFGGLRDWLSTFGSGSLLVLDEAHHAAPASSARYAIDSKLTKTVRDLSPFFEHRLFLSATPHNGHSNSFAALLEVLDPQRFCRGVPVKDRRLLDQVMVRRLKSDLRRISGGFPERDVSKISIDGLPDDAPELTLPRLLDRYASLVKARLASAPKSRQAAAGLVLISLQKRLLSSIEAFARTLAVHVKAVERHATDAPAAPSAKQLDLLAESAGPDDERADATPDELTAEEDAQVEAASRSTAGSLTNELELLREMSRIAEQHRARPDARIAWTAAWIRREMLDAKGRWNDKRLLVFTEYVDTQRWLEQQLRAALSDTPDALDRLWTYSGGMGDARRDEIQSAFNARPDRHPLRILVATDAAREGLNLQASCADLMHFDVPWNPSRMEQRNGRIDRKLQPAPVVHCRYFVHEQRPHDRVLETLVRKTQVIERELGSLSPVLESRLSGLLEGGFRADDVDALVARLETAQLDAVQRAAVEEELETLRERESALQAQVDRLRDLLEKASDFVDMRPERLRDVVGCALEIGKAPGLTPTTQDDGSDAWTFPALDRREGADPSWSETLDSLRAPRGRDQKLWEWRKQAPVRPVVFQDAGRLTDEVVHLHLEHRVVRRLLGRLRAQGFVHDDLSRTVCCQTADAIPRVLLVGRLALYGRGATRLHDEIVVVAARWSAPASRKKPLAPYAEDAEEKSWQLLREALAQRKAPVVSKDVAKQILAGCPQDLEELLPHLQQRAEKVQARAVALLAERGRRESAEMQRILDEQRARIEKVAAVTPQLSLAFSDRERQQLEDDVRHWAKRLTQLAEERETEPARIRESYEVRAPRVEPVGLAYLWPASG